MYLFRQFPEFFVLTVQVGHCINHIVLPPYKFDSVCFYSVTFTLVRIVWRVSAAVHQGQYSMENIVCIKRDIPMKI